MSETIKMLAKKALESPIRDAGEAAVRFKRKVFLGGKRLRLSGLDRVHRISIVYNEWSDKYYLKVNPKYVFCFAFIVWRLLTNCWAIVGR